MSVAGCDAGTGYLVLGLIVAGLQLVVLLAVETQYESFLVQVHAYFHFNVLQLSTLKAHLLINKAFERLEHKDFAEFISRALKKRVYTGS